MGKEIRRLIIIGIFAVVFALAYMADANFNVYRSQWHLMVGLVIIPAIFCVQLLLPLLHSHNDGRQGNYLLGEQMTFTRGFSEEKLEPIRESTRESHESEETFSQKIDILELLKLLADMEVRNQYLQLLESEFSVHYLFFVEECSHFHRCCMEYGSSLSRESTRESHESEETFSQKIDILELLKLLADMEVRNQYLQLLESEFSVHYLFFVEECSHFHRCCMEYGSSPSQLLRRQILNSIKILKDTFLTSTSLSYIQFPDRTRLPLLDQIDSIVLDVVDQVSVFEKTVIVQLEETRIRLTSADRKSGANEDINNSSRQNSLLSFSDRSHERLLELSEEVFPSLHDLHIDPLMFHEARRQVLVFLTNDSFSRFKFAKNQE
eukprot:TRINITY_DN63364_c0_g1_i1.p1 TRINITY_DN63364_c0_g1~~TRINITY_DN63364_c0_g1_i1.p1  ORF type:complete len:439 (+),score=76.07 TRINITY_DN63364_c0_g1_i1:182-1318(+)